tara:strand:- start:920 stop:1288 length:369 start_codon:yes stop_codon:yes gene_type:complete
MGAHGEICKWSDGKTRMTVRLAPLIYEAGEIAMLIGYRMGAIDGGGYEPQSAQSVLHGIREWERHNGRLTQKKAVSWLSKMYWAVAHYVEWTDLLPQFDENDEGHLLMLAYIEQIFPKFNGE